MRGLTFECIWNNGSESDIAEVKAMWRQYRAIEDEAMIARRVSQIVFIIKDEDGRVGGVSTARPVQVKFLNGHFFYEFRCFIAPPLRAPGLDTLLAVKTKAFLEQQEGSPGKFKGMLMIIEHSEIKAQRTKAVWPDSRMVFAGYTPQGHHIRIGYFKGARI